jgi:CRP-like cAMP-binding protein
MNTQPILDNIAKHINLDERETAFFLTLLQYQKVKRKQFLLQEGEICKNSIFVLKGCLRGFNVDKNGFEHILNFAPQGWWMGDMYSLITQQAGKLNVETIEETEILLLSKSNQEVLYQEIPKFERFFRILVENSLVTYQQRVLDTLSLTAEEQYASFCKRYPMLINELAQKYIAEYIGVTPEFFSKMKAQMMRKNS